MNNFIKTGFYITKIEVAGAGKKTASINLIDGLNVIYGASDTGKSYIIQVLDYVLGSKNKPKDIPEADGYNIFRVIICSRKNNDLICIERTLGDSKVSINGEKIVVKSNSSDKISLDRFLLRLCNLENTNLLKNRRGETVVLTFRTLSHIIIVDEESIIKDISPIFSVYQQSNTMESALIKHILTDKIYENLSIHTAEEKKAAKISIALLNELKNSVGEKRKALSVEDSEILFQQQIKLQLTIENLIENLDCQRNVVNQLEQKYVFLIEQRTKLSAQIEENEVSLQRFRLLNDYYQSDEKRLTTLKSVCSAISDMTSIVCPFCGTQNVSNEKLYDNFSKEQIISCLDADITSNKKLSTDLSSLLEELEEVYSSLITQQNSISQEIQEIVSEIDKAREHKLTPIQENLKRAIDKKSKIDNAIAFEQQVCDFEKKIQEQRDIANSEDADESAKLTVKDSCDLINEVKNLFKKWKFDSEKIAFSEDKQDILINNVLRANHGKGVKALGTTAFIIALMQTCLKHGKKHPSFVVIDSPLVTYKSPDVNIDAELPSDIVFDLYNSLSKDILGQTIILENTEVPNGIHANKIYFSGNSNCNSRQGFFYVE